MIMGYLMNQKKAIDFYLKTINMQQRGVKRVGVFLLNNQFFLLKRIVAFIFMGLLLMGCSSKQVETPAGIIPREKMIAVLIDIHEAEARIQAFNLHSNDSTRKIEYGYYNFIFKKHHINSTEFKASFDYYTKNLELFNKMYDEVITGLSKKQAESAGKPGIKQ